MRLCVVGLGMVGLPTALLFAGSGLAVVGVDVDEARVEAYRRGESDRFLEPGVAELLRHNAAQGLLTFATRPTAADVTIVAVGTPLQDGAPNLGGLRAALRDIVPNLRTGDVLIIESTVPPGTTLALADEFGIPADVLIGHAPERVSPGNTLTEMKENARVIGARSREGGEWIASLYKRFCSGSIAITDVTTAEFVKLAENTYRDVNIALANELLMIASHLGIDAWQAAEMANAHPRVHIHQPGPGVGGHCIGVAPHFLRVAAPKDVGLLMAARARNDAMPLVVARQIQQMCNGVKQPLVAILGTAYKPDVADDRDSPAYAVAAHLREFGVVVRLHDPLLLKNDLSETLQDADCVALLVAHTAYRSLQPGEVARLVHLPQVIDATHSLDRDRWTGAGFKFEYLGDSSSVSERALS